MTRAQVFDSLALTCENGGTAEQSGTGQCANTDPLLDRIDLDVEGSGPMAILPTAESTATPPPDSLLAARMARVDGCPECIENYALPQTVHHLTDGFRADYCCEACGHTWTTSWGDC